MEPSDSTILDELDRVVEACIDEWVANEMKARGLTSVEAEMEIRRHIEEVREGVRKKLNP